LAGEELPLGGLGLSNPAQAVRRVAEALPLLGFQPPAPPLESPMTKMIFVSLPVTDLKASIAFYTALGFERNPQFSDDAGACMVWSEAIYVMVITHAKWRTFTQRPFPAAGSAGHMLSLALESREAVDAMNVAAAAHDGQADVNPPEDLGFMYTRDLADPDGHMWAALWMDQAAVAGADQR
jgi:hypothetical protein